MSEAMHYQIVTGTAEAANGDVDKTVLAAVSGKTIRLMRGIVTVTVVATGGGGEVALEDGANGTRILEWDADALGSYPFDFGEEGYPLTTATLLNLTVDGAATTQATARATVVAKAV